MRVFTHGTGVFSEDAVAAGLEMLYKAGTTTAGVVAPTTLALLAPFQQDLAGTRANWVIDES